MTPIAVHGGNPSTQTNVAETRQNGSAHFPRRKMEISNSESVQKLKKNKQKNNLLESLVKQRRQPKVADCLSNLRTVIGLIEKGDLCAQSCIYRLLCAEGEALVMWRGVCRPGNAIGRGQIDRGGVCGVRHQCASVDFRLISETWADELKRRRGRCVV